MSESQLHRVQQDLDTIRQAAGMEPPMTREDVWLSLWLGPAGVVAFVWTLVPHGLRPHWGLVPLLLLVVIWIAFLRVKYRRSSGRSPLRRREYTWGIISAALVGALALVYRVWAGSFGLTLDTRAAIALFFAGMFTAVFALTVRGRIATLGLAIPIMIAALFMPYVSLPGAGMMGAAMAVGGPAMAAIQLWQVRAQRMSHAAH